MTPRRNLLLSRRWRIALGILAIALPATADAPQLQYDQFDSDADEVTDHFTGLVWDRRRVQKNTQAGGQIYCSATIFPGSGRLPTVKELLTIVDEQPHEAYDTTFNPPVVLKSIDQQAFPKAPTKDPYWTSTPAPGGKFWTVEFTTGTTEPRAATETLNARCVR
jgi:hypothetical protein